MDAAEGRCTLPIDRVYVAGALALLHGTVRVEGPRFITK
jgi:hypothetical protein